MTGAHWAAIAVGAIVVLRGGAMAFAAKPGAILSNEEPIERARRIVAQVWTARGLTATVTSGLDSTHSANSLHYVGLAEDYRTRDVPADQLSSMVADVRARLGTDYDVVLESDHLHVEYDPKS